MHSVGINAKPRRKPEDHFTLSGLGIRIKRMSRPTCEEWSPSDEATNKAYGGEKNQSCPPNNDGFLERQADQSPNDHAQKRQSSDEITAGISSGKFTGGDFLLGHIVTVKKDPPKGRVFSARYWTRTSDLTGVIRAL